jgi:fructose-6-phosphate aldolase 2
MELLLDTANLEAIRKYCDYYNIIGVTTNPSILSREKGPFFETCARIREIIGQEKQLHVQVTGRSCEEMLKEAEVITQRLGKDVYIKVPVIEEGVKAMKLMKARGLRVTATAVVSVQQAFLAGSVGADYVAPYVNRMENLSIDPYEAVARIREIFDNQGITTKILGASFKNTQQVMRTYEMGAEAVTVAPELLTTMCSNAVTDLWVENFEKDWINLYGDRRIYELD